MKSNFPAALAVTLEWEGGVSNHPADPGGLTNQGITQATYSGWLAGHGLPQKSVAKITTAERDEIYKANYWDRVAGDALPAGTDLAVFDLAVNSGPARAARMLQQVLHVTADGMIGPKTIAAARAADPVATVNALCDKRINFLLNLPTWEVFGRGWSRRVGAVRQKAVQMAEVDDDIIFFDPAEPAGTTFWGSVWRALVLLFTRPTTGK